MPGFIYYIPDLTTGVKVPDLRKAGLGYAFEPWDGARCVAAGVQCGPGEGSGGASGGGGDSGGGKGVVAADPRYTDPSLLGYYPDQQQWVKVPGTQAYVGWRQGQKSTPADLARPTQLNGHEVRLGDGHRWRVPVARALIEQDGDMRYSVALPTSTGLDEQGNWAPGQVVERYKPLWELACQWWDGITGAVGDQGDSDVAASFNFDGINDAALRALAANYRIGKAEVAALGVFDSRCV